MQVNRSGFTLVELLVVVGIIGLIMGMIVPSLVSVTDLAREATCKANLKVVGQAAFAYMSDQNNKDCLPMNDPAPVKYPPTPQEEMDQYLLPGKDSTMKWWCNKVYRYGVTRPAVYLCPSDPGRAGDSEPVKCGYGFNNTLTNPPGGGSGTAGGPGDGIKTMYQIKDPERTAIIGHCSDISREPAIVEEMVEPVYWPRGHLRRYDRTAKYDLGRGAFIMGSGQILVKTYADAKAKNSKDKLVLFRANR